MVWVSSFEEARRSCRGHYAGKVLQARLKPLIRKTQPYTKKIANRGDKRVAPELLAEIEYRAKLAGRKVR
jgi:bifunctional non-homologous end joining protein LigD